VVHGDIPKLQIVAIEDWFKGKMPLLPPLEHLPSAAFSGRRRPKAVAKRADPEQPELPLTFTGGKQVKRHFNLLMVKQDAPSIAPEKPDSEELDLAGGEASLVPRQPTGKRRAKQKRAS
ncbi:MAG: hypothetical protein ABL962_17080, partial [Fimbriimonadaceae bacterium]